MTEKFLHSEPITRLQEWAVDPHTQQPVSTDSILYRTFTQRHYLIFRYKRLYFWVVYTFVRTYVLSEGCLWQRSAALYFRNFSLYFPFSIYFCMFLFYDYSHGFYQSLCKSIISNSYQVSHPYYNHYKCPYYHHY